MSDRTVRLAMIVLGVIGLGVAGYLTYTHYAGVNPVCSLSHGCEKVQSSSYSKLAGVPVAAIGLGGYLLILATLLAPDTEDMRLVAVALTVVGFGFSAYLTYRELASIHAICQWCVGSALIMTLLAILAAARVLRGPGHPPGPTLREPAPMV
jgi:uncharacterized membrane protein